MIHIPIWFDGGKKERYDLPTELKDLRVGGDKRTFYFIYSGYCSCG